MAARDTRNLLLRLDPHLADQLHAVAEVEGRTTSDVVREAIAALVDARRRDPAFTRLLAANRASHDALLRLLADDEEPAPE